MKPRHVAERLVGGKPHQDSGYVLRDELGVRARTDWLVLKLLRVILRAG